MADVTVTMLDAAAAGVGAAPGQLTLGSIRTLVKGFLGRTGTGEDNDLLLLLNQSQQQIARQRRWSCLRVQDTGATDADEDTYSWPGQMRALVDFRLLGGERRSLVKIEQSLAGMIYPDPDTNPAAAIPSYYLDLGLQYRLIPTPDDEYDWAMTYDKWPTDLSDDEDNSDLLNMDDLLTYLTAMHLALRLGLLADYDKFRRMVYTTYPPDSSNKTGLLHQCIKADRIHTPRRIIKRPFWIGDGQGWPANYLTNPRVGLP